MNWKDLEETDYSLLSFIKEKEGSCDHILVCVSVPTIYQLLK